MNWEILDVKAGFRKGRRTRDQIASIRWVIQKATDFQKIVYFYIIDYTKAFDCVDPKNCGKLFKRWDYQTTLPASWKIHMQVKKHQLGLDMEQQTGFNSGKEYAKAVYCHPAYLTSMKNTSGKMPGWVNHKLEPRFLGKISTTSDMQITPPLYQKVKNRRASFWKWKRRRKKLA